MTESTYQAFDYNADLMRALLWRHNNAPNLTALIAQKQAWYAANHEEFWLNWFNEVFALEYANDFGCAVWALILNLPVNINGTPLTQVPFGFGQFNENFNNGNFAAAETNTVFLSTIEKQQVLLLRFWQLVSKGRLVEDNSMLYRIMLQPREIYNGYEYVAGWPGMVNYSSPTLIWPFLVDNLNMTLSCTLNPPISPQLANVIIDYDLLPRASGVKINITNNTGS